MKHIIITNFGKVKVNPIFDDEYPTIYKCHLLADKNVIVRVRDLHKLSSKLEQRIRELNKFNERMNKRLNFILR